jgi:hypothetical protein
MKTPARTTMAAFWREVEVVGRKDGACCYTWKGGRASDGSPIFSFAGQTVRAARFLWEAVEGLVPARHKVVRTCGNALCVNTEHGELQREGKPETRQVAA